MPPLRRPIFERIVVLAAAVVASLCFAPSIPAALAQEIKQQIAGTPGQELPLPLELPAQPGQDAAASAGFVRILGLPTSFSLNCGFAAAGAWAVLLKDVSGLTLSTPADFQGNLLLTIELVRDQGAEPLRWQVRIALGQKGAATAPPPASMAGMIPASPDGPQPQPAESIGTIKAAPPLRAASRALMNRARELLKNADIAAARLIFKRLAETGVAEAAFNLAQTYDPDFLKTIPTLGLEPDPAMARQWYERAAAMGDAAAASRIAELDAR